MKDLDIKDKILLATLPNVVFDGWSEEAVTQGAIEAGYDKAMAIRAFPNGIADVLAHFADWVNRNMSMQLAQMDIANMPLGKKLLEAMRIRLELEAPYKDAVQKAMTYYSVPTHALSGTQMVWKAVDEMWWMAGDESVDFNYYTKRASLGAVYTATMYYWLSDESENSEKTLIFFEKRLKDVVNAIKTRKAIQGKIGGLLKKVACSAPKFGPLGR